MRNFVIFIIIVLGISSCVIFNKKGSIELETLPNDLAQKYAASITEKDLEKHLTVLASDEYEGRETAMPGQKKAAKYIENHFSAIGLAPGLSDDSYQQSFPVELKDPSKVEFKINGTELTFLDHFYYLGNLNDTVYNQVEVVELGFGVDAETYSDYKNKDVAGKFILIKEGIPEKIELSAAWGSWRNKLDAAANHGALGMITIQNKFDDRVDQIRMFVENPRMQLHDKGNQQYNYSIPNIYVSDSLVNAYEWNGEMTVDLAIQTKELLSSENVLGFMEGTDLKEEIVVITAHYDHIGYDNGEICNGADDDGSGTVSLLEIAEAFTLAKSAGNGPRRSILFMTVSGEEKGLLGSQYYSEHPVYPLENTVVDLNIDMIGRKDSLHDNDQYVYLIGADRISKDLHYISEEVNKELIDFYLDYTYNEEDDPNHFYYRSDHYNFAKHNIPVIFYFSGVHEDYHKPTDDVDKILFPKLAKTAKLIFYTAWEIANRTERIRKNA
ncbi:M28 family peptidase [Parvicella tangerina]|uniref:Peptidase M28 domain-containing protein n=1 Tax=Parvicella tangerina TaxID=2829795 RepID=A0A916NP73_9FLAO|nr:M28 family peptidase [Parvicella tangerina]CAG5076248.1 hypothetical protein CRYO30217_00002 [Parvicella tangerina]